MQCSFNKTSIKEITRLDPEGMTDLYCWLEPPPSKGVSGRFNRAFHALGLLWQIIAPAAYFCGTLRYNVKYDMAMIIHRLRQVGNEKPQPLNTDSIMLSKLDCYTCSHLMYSFQWLRQFNSVIVNSLARCL